MCYFCGLRQTYIGEKIRRYQIHEIIASSLRQNVEQISLLDFTDNRDH